MIKQPMDLGSVRSGLDANLYESDADVCRDVKLTISNAMKFWPRDNAVYKKAYEAHYKEPLASFGLPQFMSVLGGDDDLGLPGMWFTWADPFDIITWEALPRLWAQEGPL